MATKNEIGNNIVCTIAMQYAFTAKTIADLFSSCFEGGYSPWLARVDLTSSDHEPKPGLVFWGTPAVFVGNYAIAAQYDRPSDPEGSAKGRFTITPEAVKKGLQILAEKAPGTFHNLMVEDADALDADVFVQYIIFGDIIYG